MSNGSGVQAIVDHGRRAPAHNRHEPRAANAAIVKAILPVLLAITGWAAPAMSQEAVAPATRNRDAAEGACNVVEPRAGGLVDIAPDGTGSTALHRDCVILSGERRAAQIARTIEVSDGARGPESRPGIATADSGSYALSLVNVRPAWTTADLTGEADGMSIFVRQAKGDTAAILANVGVRAGFAATLESLTFAADSDGQPTRAVRTQLGVVNPRDGGEYGLVLQAEKGDGLSAGLRIASIGPATWTNFIEAVNPAGETLVSIRAGDGAIVAGDLLPTADLHKTIGKPDNRYAATYTQVLQLSAVPFAGLPACGEGQGAGLLAHVADATRAPTAWGQIVDRGGGSHPAFVKCDGKGWATF